MRKSEGETKNTTNKRKQRESFINKSKILTGKSSSNTRGWQERLESKAFQYQELVLEVCTIFG
ncbi:hypothetical protein J4457_03580 [Candidatus Woesearchaeota archaeon]|nr:hypothetical protein [Candidatus Woesearchaeota archaeon]